MGTLDGKVALVTGAGQGIGRGIARALAFEGAQVALVGRTASKLDHVANEIAGEGGLRPLTIAADIKEDSEITRCVDVVVDQCGTVDILVNNAQEFAVGTLLDLSRADFDASLLSGPIAAFSFMKTCQPHLVGGGVIINIGAAAGLRPEMGGHGVYAATKEATRTLTRAAAVEWGPLGIRAVNLVPLAFSPAYADWEVDHPEEARVFAESIPLVRVGDSEADIGRVAVFLCGPDSSYITGTSIMVDGGQGYLR
jgi:meso-butanediol dehydrogenase/(S,S)-butanediol dehydrogenase/diacetyl reductase